MNEQQFLKLWREADISIIPGNLYTSEDSSQKNKKTDDQLLTPKDISALLKCGKTTAYKLFNLKGFPKVKIGKRYYVKESSFWEYISDHEHTNINL